MDTVVGGSDVGRTATCRGDIVQVDSGVGVDQEPVLFHYILTDVLNCI